MSFISSSTPQGICCFSPFHIFVLLLLFLNSLLIQNLDPIILHTFYSFAQVWHTQKLVAELSTHTTGKSKPTSKNLLHRFDFRQNLHTVSHTKPKRAIDELRKVPTHV